MKTFILNNEKHLSYTKDTTLDDISL